MLFNTRRQSYNQDRIYITYYLLTCNYILMVTIYTVISSAQFEIIFTVPIECYSLNSGQSCNAYCNSNVSVRSALHAQYILM